MNTSEEKKSSKQRLVYDLIYPAVLGSMFYDLFQFPLQISYFLYIIKVSIVLFYLLDYYHLYHYMDNIFTQKQKNTWTYVLFDLLVSILLLFSFKYLTVDLNIAIWTFAVIPFCFLMYSIKLKFNVKLYTVMTFISLGGVVLVTIILPKIEFTKDSGLISSLLFTSTLTVFYFFYVASRKIAN